MRASSSRVRRHFAQFDDELQDSDQTISTPVRHLQPRARLPTVTDASNSGDSVRTRFPTSAYFSDTTDDDISRPVVRPSGRSRLSASAYNRPTQKRSVREPLHMSAGPREHVPRLHIESIQFPVTRSVLWDRRRLSENSIGVSLEQVLPHFILSAGALKEIYRLYNEESGVRGTPLCYLYGHVTSPRVKKVLLDGATTKKEVRTGTWCIPVHTVADGKDPGLSQESYLSTIKAVQGSYCDEYSDNVASKLQPKLLVFRSSPHGAQLDFQLECAASPVLFKFTLVRNLPLLMTPLAASLAKREFSAHSGNLRSGYLTLDRTRKAVPLLKVDPLVLQQPLVGVWVYGVQIDDAWNEEAARRQLADPFLYFACIGYLMSKTVKERVGPEKNTFLVALYPANDGNNGGTASSLPRFFECSFSEFLLPQSRPLPMELYSHRRSCLVGVSKFSSDVEFHLSAAPTSEWEAARRQAHIPTAPRSEVKEPASIEVHGFDDNNVQESSCRSQNDACSVLSEEEHNLTSGWTITADAIPKGSIGKNKQRKALASEKEISAVEDSPGETEAKPEISTCDEDLHNESCTHAAKEASSLSPPNETKEFGQRGWVGNNTSSYRSCCKTQQLLTIQHQQILENQQKQLHEMQEQIVQLRRLLHAARTCSSSKKQAYTSPNDGGYDSDASSSSAGAVADVSNVSSTFSRHGNGPVSSQSSMVSGLRRNGEDPSSDRSSVYTHEDEKGGEDDEEEADKEKDKENSLSSLGLSSISSGSDADLSSLSSSLVSERLKKRDLSGSDPCEVQDTAEAEGLSRSQLSQLSGDKQDSLEPAGSEAKAGVGADDQEHEGSDNSSSPHNLSIDELGASLVKEADKEADTGVNLTIDEKEDGDNFNSSAVERLLPPDAYLRKVGGFVDHHGGCFTTPPLDFHSFCVPRIKFSTKTPECSVSDSEDEEIRLIEQKYKRLMAVCTSSD